jgi:integrase
VRGYLRKRGQSWQLIVNGGVDPLTGKRRHISKTVQGTKRDAENALSKFLVEVGGGQHVASNTTMGELLDRWFELSSPDWSPATAQVTRWFMDLYIRPRLGPLPLRKITVAELDRFYAQLRDEGGEGGKPLSPGTVRRVHNIVRRALEQALRWGWIVGNPAAHASPPRLQRREQKPPSSDEIAVLFRAAEEDDPDFATYVRLAAASGARRGELCGLRWKALDLAGATVLIARSIARGDEGLVDKDTKTHQARRIALDASTIEILRAHRGRCEQRALMAGTALSDDGYVFSYQVDGSAPWPPNSVTQHFGRLRRRVGLDHVRLHDLRHYVATRLIASGVPIRTVSGRLGHANAATTLGVYAHFVAATDQDAADLLGGLLDNGVSTKDVPAAQ